MHCPLSSHCYMPRAPTTLPTTRLPVCTALVPVFTGATPAFDHAQHCGPRPVLCLVMVLAWWLRHATPHTATLDTHQGQAARCEPTKDFWSHKTCNYEAASAEQCHHNIRRRGTYCWDSFKCLHQLGAPARLLANAEADIMA